MNGVFWYIGESEQFEQVVFRVFPLRMTIFSQRAIRHVQSRMTKPVVISGLLLIATICGLWYYKRSDIHILIYS